MWCPAAAAASVRPARAAAQRGAQVSLTYRDRADAAQAGSRDPPRGGKAPAHRAGRRPRGRRCGRPCALRRAGFGAPRAVVVSAGVFEHATIEDMSSEFWQRTMDTNLTGTMWSVKAAAELMRAGSGGSIVIYTSTAGQSGGGDGAAAYCVSKAGQIMFMKCMAMELAKHRIRVNCIAPAWTETDMAAASLDRLGRDKVAKSFPLGRIGLPDDVAKATCFLLSQESGVHHRHHRHGR